MMYRETPTVLLVLILLALQALAAGCGGGGGGSGYIDPGPVYHYVKTVTFPSEITEGSNTFEITVTVVVPDKPEFIEGLEDYHEMLAEIEPPDEQGYHFRCVMQPITAMVNGHFIFESQLPRDPPYAEGEIRFSSVPTTISLSVGTYDLYIASGLPPCGDSILELRYLGTFEVVPAESAE